MENKPFRWGIIGPGRIARKFADALTVVDGGILYAVASRELERARAFSNKYQAEKSFGSYAEMVEDPDVDGVYVATPHPFHYENSLLSLKAGKPVLCEKPLTVNAAEADQLIKAARSNKTFLMEAMWTRFLPVLQQVRQWLDDGRIGKVKLLTSTFGFRAARELEDRAFNPNLGGGVLLDLGVYNISISQWVLGQDALSFATQGILGETKVDELTAVNLLYENGAVSQFTCNMVSDTTNDMYVYGTEGHIYIHPQFWRPTAATLVSGGQETMETRSFRKNGFEYQIEEAITCIRSGLLESPRMPHAQTLSNMQLMDEIRAQIGLIYPFEKQK
ncbi:MAG: Gfo/Idh/MocA family oxidoreductase [Chloroflexi bacterium]|nr:Gfo/Idh/MocA family oxidoreductase [Chloroflexota bacterium]